jgi:signal transduction histidine kinase
LGERLSRELRVFHELARVVASGPYRVEDILDGISAEVRRAFGFERALLVRYDAENETVHAVVQQGVDWPGEDWLPIAMFPFLQRALGEGSAVHIADAAAEAAVPAQIVERFDVRSLVAVPLSVENRCVGFLVFDRAGGKFSLDKSDIELLTALGPVAAVLIDKADQFAELERAVEELRTLDTAKSEFVSIASHELRTPIAVVHGVASTLHFRGDALTHEQLHELRRTLYGQTTRLVDLAEQLLDLSRFEAGVVVVQPDRFRPRQRIDELLLRLVPDRLQDVRVEVDPTLEVITDPDAFERVVSNLVTNALRYGRPPVVVRADTTSRFRLLVEDQGDGVEPSFVPRLFDRFTRSEAASKHTGGAGLGLAIATSFAGALGGELTYEAAHPSGARFALELPSRVLAA